MHTINELKYITSKENAIFYKPGCPFCAASEVLMKILVEKNIIPDYKVYMLDKDFDNDTLLELVLAYGWKADSHQKYPTKPQIFINSNGETDFIGGNFEFYKSKWNRGDNQSGKIKIADKLIDAPMLTNPMKF